MLNKLKQWFSSINPYQRKIDFLTNEWESLRYEHVIMVSALVLKNGGEVNLENEFLEAVADEDNPMTLQVIQTDSGYTFKVVRVGDTTVQE